jgi:GNAT superfamily N-acetyltransferase
MRDHIIIRPFEPSESEYEAIARIGNEIFPEYLYSASQIRFEDEAFDTKKYAFARHVALDARRGEILGYAEYNHIPMAFHPQKFWIWIAVSLAAQKQGIGSALYEHILGELRSRGASTLKTQARETMMPTLRFLQQRGYVEDMRSWESRLYLKNFDWRKFDPETECANTIEISTLAQEKLDDPNWLDKAYRLHTACMADVPSTDAYTKPSLDFYVRRQIENPDALLDGYFIAKEGTNWIGESFLRKNPEQPKVLYQGLTGVLREHRRKGVAMALKLKTISYAQEHGYDVIKTWNATVNEGMLGINVKLGFVRQPAWINFVKNL